MVSGLGLLSHELFRPQFLGGRRVLPLFDGSLVEYRDHFPVDSMSVSHCWVWADEGPGLQQSIAIAVASIYIAHDYQNMINDVQQSSRTPFYIVSYWTVLPFHTRRQYRPLCGECIGSRRRTEYFQDDSTLG